MGYVIAEYVKPYFGFVLRDCMPSSFLPPTLERAVLMLLYRPELMTGGRADRDVRFFPILPA